jgi:hypothetical protein
MSGSRAVVHPHVNIDRTRSGSAPFVRSALREFQPRGMPVVDVGVPARCPESMGAHCRGPMGSGHRWILPDIAAGPAASHRRRTALRNRPAHQWRPHHQRPRETSRAIACWPRRKGATSLGARPFDPSRKADPRPAGRRGSEVALQSSPQSHDSSASSSPSCLASLSR